jgi:hypothetical protein
LGFFDIEVIASTSGFGEEDEGPGRGAGTGMGTGRASGADAGAAR